MTKNKLLGLALWIVVSLVLVNLAVFGFWLKNRETNKNIKNEESWETHISKNLGIKVNYPLELLIEEKNNYLRIYSSPVDCLTSNQRTGKVNNISASEINIEFLQYEVDSPRDYSELWQEVFGYKLIDDHGDNFDGKSLIDNKEAYYVYQGAELTYGRKIYLVKQSPTKALKIIVNTPSLVYDCEQPLDQYSQERIGYDLNEEILSTVTFPIKRRI